MALANFNRTGLAAACAACAALLASCVASGPYKPSDAADAARLRVRLVYPDGYHSYAWGHSVSAWSNLRPVAAAACGEVTALPQLRSFSGQARPAPPPGSPTPPPELFPRAGMPGATMAQNSESAELRLTPGVHVLTYQALHRHGNISTDTCNIGQVALKLDANRQYEVLIGFSEPTRCTRQLLVLEGDSFRPLAPLKQGAPGQVCDGNNFKG